MLVRGSLIAVVCLLLGLVAGAWAASRLASRADLAPPAGASPEVQRAIAAAGPVNVAARKLLRPQSVDQWRVVIAERASEQTLAIDKFGAGLGVTIRADEIAGVPVHRVKPLADGDQVVGALFVYLHGGAYVFGGGDAGAREAALITAMSGIESVSIDYRMPPDHPHPAAVDDVEAVYRELLQQTPAATMAMGGTSAGGGLTMAALHRFKAIGLPMPSALYLGTPWADLTKTSDTLYTLEGVDRVLGTYDGILEAAALLYAGDTPLTDPLVSPVYGDFEGFPPAYLVTGTRDMLLSDTARVAQKMRVAGGDVELIVFEGLSHAEYAFVGDSPEMRQAYEGLSEFLLQHVARSAP